MSGTDRTYGTLPAWMEAPSKATNPRENVWHPVNSDKYREIKYAFEYFGMHDTVKGSDTCATALTTLRYSDFDTRETTECRVCLQKLGFILYWDGTEHAAEITAPVVAIVFQSMGTCPPPYWHIPFARLAGRSEGRRGPLKFSHHSFKDVMYWVVRGTTQRWFRLIRRPHSYYAMLVSRPSPRAGRRGDDD